MVFLSHLSPTDQAQLKVMNDDWPVFFLPCYTRFLKEYHQEGLFVAYDKILNAYMPLRILRSKYIRPAQVVFPPHRNGIELSSTDQESFFERLLQKLAAWGKCDRVIQPHPSGIMAGCPSGARCCSYGTYIVELEHQTIEDIYKKFSPKYQKAVRQAANKHLVLKTGREHLNNFYKLYCETMNRAGMAIEPLEFFHAQFDIMGDQYVNCCVVYDGEKPVSSLLVLYSRYSALLTHAGTPDEAGMHGATKFLHYEMMKVMKAAGARKYDFVGVRLNNTNPTLEGIFNFKKRFGGDLKTGYLWKYDIHNVRCKIFDTLIWVKLRGKTSPDIIDQERLALPPPRNHAD
jgi:lipid II:glycine glycyltransferase (peptidoglycan interpeptide bridge formation enzyme)